MLLVLRLTLVLNLGIGRGNAYKYCGLYEGKENHQRDNIWKVTHPDSWRQGERVCPEHTHSLVCVQDTATCVDHIRRLRKVSRGSTYNLIRYNTSVFFDWLELAHLSLTDILKRKSNKEGKGRKIIKRGNKDKLVFKSRRE